MHSILVYNIQLRKTLLYLARVPFSPFASIIMPCFKFDFNSIKHHCHQNMTVVIVTGAALNTFVISPVFTSLALVQFVISVAAVFVFFCTILVAIVSIVVTTFVAALVAVDSIISVEAVVFFLRVVILVLFVAFVWF